jgi:magnesium transporter
MKPVVLCVSNTATVAETLAQIRAANLDEDLHYIFVVDERGRYVGNVPVRLLLTRPEHMRIESLVEADALFVRVDTDRDEVRTLFRKHDLTAVPVLDHEGQLVGRVTRNGE